VWGRRGRGWRREVTCGATNSQPVRMLRNATSARISRFIVAEWWYELSRTCGRHMCTVRSELRASAYSTQFVPKRRVEWLALYSGGPALGTCSVD
jgi:hypothetical protein